jgi:KDO2-lipid IV(A) lauroyltransferase
MLGAFADLVLRKERRKAMRNLALAMPERSPEEHRAIVRAMFRHLGMSLLEICWLPKLNPKNVRQLNRFEGLEHFDSAAKSGQGTVIFTGHCGNWEWLASTTAILGYDISVIAREISNERLNDFIVASRAQHGLKTIGRGSVNAARELLRTLKGGGFLGALIDQSIRAENVEVDFFGHPAWTPVGAARMAIRGGSLVMSAFIERLPDGTQLIRFSEPRPTSRDDDPVALTQEMTHAIEEQIRRVPEQWVWMHERWKKRK